MDPDWELNSAKKTIVFQIQNCGVILAFTRMSIRDDMVWVCHAASLLCTLPKNKNPSRGGEITSLIPGVEGGSAHDWLEGR